MEFMGSDQRKCSFCGEEIPESQRRCPYCGSLLEARVNENRDIFSTGNPVNIEGVLKPESVSQQFSNNNNSSSDAISQSSSPATNFDVRPPDVRPSDVKPPDVGPSAVRPLNVRQPYGANQTGRPFNSQPNRNYNVNYTAKPKPLGNGLKVFLTVLAAIVPGIGQLVGVITAIVFMNSDGDSDRRSFGIALLVASLLMFVIACILGFIAAVAIPML